jgi:Rab-GTPase-TBC domain
MKSPRLHAHLTSPQLALRHDVYLKDIFTSLFTESLTLDNATRLWDVMVFEGDAVLVRAAVAYLTAMEGKLFGAESVRQVYDTIGGGLDNFGEEQWMNAVRDAGKS